MLSSQTCLWIIMNFETNLWSSQPPAEKQSEIDSVKSLEINVAVF